MHERLGAAQTGWGDGARGRYWHDPAGWRKFRDEPSAADSTAQSVLNSNTAGSLTTSDR
jgi:hypothetical protein